MVFFLISSKVSGLLKQLQIFQVVSCRITRTFNKSRANHDVPLDISKALHRVWYASLLHKLMSFGISVWIFGLTTFFLSNKHPRKVLDERFSQKYLINGGVYKGPIFDPSMQMIYFLLQV